MGRHHLYRHSLGVQFLPICISFGQNTFKEAPETFSFSLLLLTFLFFCPYLAHRKYIFLISNDSGSLTTSLIPNLFFLVSKASSVILLSWRCESGTSICIWYLPTCKRDKAMFLCSLKGWKGGGILSCVEGKSYTGSVTFSKNGLYPNFGLSLGLFKLFLEGEDWWSAKD